MAARGQSPVSTEWPRVFVRDGATNTVYQPQLESWDYCTLKAISAVAVQPAGTAQPVYGTIGFVATTRVDRAERQVVIESLQITNADFPFAGPQADVYLATLRSLLPKEVKTISLDRLEACLALQQAREKSYRQSLRNDPPAILFSSTPALLVLVDGPAVYRPVEKTKLERVFNTRALILRNKSGTHYLHLFDGYVEAPALSGPWTVAKKVPGDVNKAEQQAVAAKQVDLLAGQENPETKAKPSLKSTPLPTLYVETVATELIVTEGEPQWAPIPSTQLFYITNTSSHVFKELNNLKTYVLLAGRWFRRTSFDGPWEFVPGLELPSDFANIPDDSPQENVKASVPGTRQADEAAIANFIPHTVKVARLDAVMDPLPQYDGDPELKPIEDTPLQYVANCPVPVIQVDPQTWYACNNGVWFVATAAGGPWSVATSVPAVIYSIPPSSPVHYVVYARIYRFDADSVWVGTTPGFYGTVVGPDGVVVYGTGYVYPAYVGPKIYVSYPVTYGYGSDPCWTPWTGWAFGFSAGFAMAGSWNYWCCCPPAPYWLPYWGTCYGSQYNAYGGITAWGPYGWAGTSGYIYHQKETWTGVSRAAAGSNPWTGNQWASQYGRAYNSTTGTRIAGRRGAVENVYAGNYAASARGTIYNEKTGNAAHSARFAGNQGGAIDVNSHVIAGQNGNYFRPNGEGGWSQISRPAEVASVQEWHPSNISSQERQSLNNQYYARQWGAQRQQSFQMNRPHYGGGGFHGR